MYNIGQKVIHPLHGVGVVERIEEKIILGKCSQFAVISFQNDRLKIMINLNQSNSLIRDLVGKEEVPKVLKFMKRCKSELPAKSSERYNINLKKIKSADIYQVAEVIKDLSDLSTIKKLSPKELSMLKQTKKLLSTEFSYITEMTPEEIEEMIDQSCREERVAVTV
jgi:CarD family transcriptional regulator